MADMSWRFEFRFEEQSNVFSPHRVRLERLRTLLRGPVHKFDDTIAFLGDERHGVGCQYENSRSRYNLPQAILGLLLKLRIANRQPFVHGEYIRADRCHNGESQSHHHAG